MVVLSGVTVRNILKATPYNKVLLCTVRINTVSKKSMATVTFATENVHGDCSGFMQGNVAKTKKGLIVLQEWWGLNEQIKEEAKMIGNKGNFVTLVPDLYRGKVATDNEEAGHLMNNLDWSGAVKDIQGAAIYLLSQGCKKVGVTGFCMGGALSLAAAALVPEISAAAPFYGIPDKGLCDVGTIKIPVQAHFGDQDDYKGFSSPEDAQALAKKLTGNKNFELFMYAGCGHAFTNPTGPLGNYDKKACELAIGRLVDFMNKFFSLRVVINTKNV